MRGNHLKTSRSRKATCDPRHRRRRLHWLAHLRGAGPGRHAVSHPRQLLQQPPLGARAPRAHHGRSAGNRRGRCARCRAAATPVCRAPDQRSGPLRRPQGRGRVGARAAALLRQQCRRQPCAAAGHAGRGRAHAGVFVLGHGVRRIGRAAAARGLPPFGDQPLRLEQVHGRAHARRPRPGRAGPMAHRAAALLQPCGRARKRPDRRRPAGRAEQPFPLHRTGGDGPA
jgi:hypothetical protein